ncbi:MAG: HEPN domain-containing protein, partial [Candidatus Parabeggiatoa sp.]|nr:HEPN domain-containing protein [Candidatus Parabeggiatoa sp.]
KKIARSRLQESEILFSNRKYDAAVYLSGYAIELALKARICKTLKWSQFPDSSIKNPQTFKTNNDKDCLYVETRCSRLYNMTRGRDAKHHVSTSNYDARKRREASRLYIKYYE